MPFGSGLYGRVLLAGSLCTAIPAVDAATYQVTDEATLRQAIIDANSQTGPHFIEFKADVTLTTALPPVLNSVTFQGGSHALNGAASHRLLFIGADDTAGGPRILVNINNLRLTNGLASGGDGADGGGGGLGAGGALFINTRADVVLNNVGLDNNRAEGGGGGITAGGNAGGGGGLGGDGGQVHGGGGGRAGQGGDGTGAAGGGGGALADGGDGVADQAGGGGGLADGGSGVSPGADGSWEQPWRSGDAGDGAAGGPGGSQGGGGGAGGAGSGAGGGGFAGADGAADDGGAGGNLGGGGGGTTGAGGAGGFAGGGGGSVADAGGAGGFGGGGGGSGAGAGGAGGFGGGGGAGVQGGDGGYGAGGGAGGTGGHAGTGAGAGSATQGGGGAGLGGAIFVAEGGGLTVGGSTSVNGGSVVAGSGAHHGSAAGNGLFLQGSGNLSLRGPANGSLIIADDISDAVGAGLAGANDYDRWNLIISGADIDGRVVLSGDNRYSGDTYVSDTTLVVAEDRHLGGSLGMVVLDNGGLAMGDGFTLARDVLVNARGGVLGVDTGQSATLNSNLHGDGGVRKEGGGDLVLAVDTAFQGNWVVGDGHLVIDRDARLGNSSLWLDGGGLRFSAAFDDLRTVTVTGNGGVLDAGGHAVRLENGVLGDGDVTYTGGGQFTVTGVLGHAGNTVVNNATTLSGGVGSGSLILSSDAVYNLDGQDRQVRDIQGSGTVQLDDGHLLTLLAEFDADNPEVLFNGTLTGTGGLVMAGVAESVMRLSGTNTYSGGTRLVSGQLTVSRDENLGTGGVTFAGGTLLFDMDATTQRDYVMAGDGTLAQRGGTLEVSGVIAGAGDLTLTGGTTIFSNANTFQGDTIVKGANSLLGLRTGASIGDGNLVLSELGGLLLLGDTADLQTVILQSGGGTINTNGFEVVSQGGIIGSQPGDRLVKDGLGTLVLAGTSQYQGGTDIRAGVLQVGQGALDGSLAGNVNIGQNARLDIDRAGTLTLDGVISGAGAVRKTGTGTLAFTGSHSNLFQGGLHVEQGYVSFDSAGLLGLSPVLLDGGGLLFGSDLNASLELGANNGELVVDAGAAFSLLGDTAGTGLLEKNGQGTLIVTGVVAHDGGTHVTAGTLQVGDGLRGILAGDVDVAAGARVAFGRDDLSAYQHTLQGAGAMVMRGNGELVLTSAQTYTGGTHVERGTLRVGMGGTSGSILGDAVIDSGARLIFDRSDDLLFDGDVSGDGELVTTSAGTLMLTGAATHTGGTRVAGGGLQIGDGGTAGSLAGDVQLSSGTRLLLNRSDTLSLTGDLSGAGGLWQIGTGTTVLSGHNTFTGDVRVRAGRLAADADNRLGGGELILDGGAFAWSQAFDNLRGVRLTNAGGTLDTNGFDVQYSQIISGNGAFTKAGSGVLALTGVLAATQTRVSGGELRVGAGGTQGTLLGDVRIDHGAALGFERSDPFNFSGVLSGDGDIHQRGTGSLFLTGDSLLFDGQTTVHSGRLHLDGVLGGDLSVQGGTLLGNGRLGGDLVIASGGTLAVGASVGALRVDGDASFDPGGTWQVDVRADGTADHLSVGGTATLAGDVQILAGGGGDYLDGSVYRLLDANSVAGTFDTLSSDLVFLTPTLRYGSDFVELVLGRNDTAFTQISLTRNQQAVAGALDRMDPAHPVTAYVSGLNATGARDAYDELSGDTLLAGLTTGTRIGRQFSDHLQQRTSRLGVASRGRVEQRLQQDLQTLAGNAPVIAEPLPAANGPVRPLEGAWVQAQQLQIREKGDQGIGNPDLTVDGQMLTAGLDGYWRDDLIVGAAVGITEGDLSFGDRRASGELSGWQAGLYSRWDSGGALHLKAALNHGETELDQRRTTPPGGEAATSSSTVTGTRLTLEAGLGLHAGNYGLRPFAALTMQRMQRDGFREQTGGDAGLQVADGDYDNGEIGLGLEVSRPWLLGDERWAQLQGGLSLIKPFGDTRLTQRTSVLGTGVPFSVSASDAGALEMGLTAGGEVYLAKGISLWAGYQGRFGDTLEEHNALLSFNVRW
jgi:fibronectin-binding autotransporter adhesin